MKHLKTFEYYVDEYVDVIDKATLYDQMEDLIQQANDLLSKHPRRIKRVNLAGPDEAIQALSNVDTPEAIIVLNDIKNLKDTIDKIESKEEEYSNSDYINDEDFE